MFCKKCGRKLNESSKFCAGCGSAVTGSAPIPPGPVGGVPASTPPPGGQAKKPFPLKTLLLILIPAIVVVVGVVIAITLFAGNLGGGGAVGSRNDILMTDSISFFREDGRTVVAVNNEETFTVNGEHSWSRQSMDGRAAILVTDHDWEFGGTLWLVTAAGATRIADDVIHSVIAPSGDGVLYLTDFDDRNDVATLYLYDVESGRSRRLSNEAFHTWEGTTTMISPDGRSVGFVVEEADDILMGYLVINGEIERLGENTIAIAIADNGRYVYFMRMRERDRDRTWSLYVRSGDDEERLVRDIDMGINLLFNQDLSQVILSVDGRALLSRNGGEIERLGNQSIHGVVQSQVANYWTNIWVGSWINVSLSGVDSFANRVVSTWAEGAGSNVLYINRDFETERIPGTSRARFHHSMLVDNGSSLIFLDIDEPRRLSRVAVGDEQAEVDMLGRNVRNFHASDDGRAIYFVDEFGELRFIGIDGDSHRIGSDVSTWSMAMLPNSNKIFYIEDYDYRFGGDLSYSDNGESRQRVRGATEVTDVWSTPTSIFYRNIDGDVFRSNGDGNFERVSRGHDW